MNQQLADFYYSQRRIKKQTEKAIDVTKPPCKRLAFIYQRLSTHEQMQDHLFSIKMQDSLAEMAQRDGYPQSLIYVEKRDMGLSGTLSSDERPGLAYLIKLIEDDKVESVYVVHTSRLYRDQTMIDGFAFGELCKKHGVIIITPTMRLDLRNEMHMRVYRMELDWAAQELKMIKERMAGARSFKGKQGFYAGGPLAAGYILDTNKDSPTFEKLIPFEPHAEVIRYLFKKTLEHQARFIKVVQCAHDDGIFFPFFPQDLAPIMNHRTSLRYTKTHSRGWIIHHTLVHSVVCNPVYIGWWMWKGEVVSRKNHPPIIDEETFWAVQEIIRSKKGKTWSKTEVLPLSGLLFCGNHGDEKPIRIFASRSHRNYACYGFYKFGIDNGLCLAVTNYNLDKPICSFIVSQCSYANHLEKVVEQLKDAYSYEKEKAAAKKREWERLAGEIENLKSHMAITKSQEQATLILEEIDKRMAERRALEKESSAIERVMPQFDINRVKIFLSNIDSKWEELPDSLKNEFLSIILDRIMIRHERARVTAEIKWRTGLVQKLWIKRPHEPHHDNHFWTEEEQERLRTHFANKSINEIQAMFPNRSWNAILHEAKKLKLRRKRMGSKNQWNSVKWTKEDEQVVRRYYAGEIDINEAAELTGRTTFAVRNRGIQNLGLKIPREQYRLRKAVEWGVEDDGFGGKVVSQLQEALEAKNDTLSKFCSSARHKRRIN